MKIVILSICFIFIPLPLYAGELTVEEISKLDLEELMSLDVIVTSVAKDLKNLLMQLLQFMF